MNGTSFVATAWSDLHHAGRREIVHEMSVTTGDLRGEKTIEGRQIGQRGNVTEMETDSAEINSRQDLTTGPPMSPSAAQMHFTKLLKHFLSTPSDWP
jgi:hypothetical protein